MKRILSIFISAVIALSVSAASPKLASEKIFDDIDYYDTSLSVMIVEKKDKIVKSVSFKNNPDLLKKIKKAISTDREKAESKTLSSCDGDISEYFDIITDDSTVKIGLNQTKSKEIYFFIKILPLRGKGNSGKASGSKGLKSTIPSKKTKQTVKKTKRTSSSSNFQRTITIYTDGSSDDCYVYVQSES